MGKLNNNSEAEQIEIVKNNWQDIRYISNPSQDVQLAAINTNPRAIGLINNPTEDAQLMAVNRNAGTIITIREPTNAVYMAAIKGDPHTIQYVKVQPKSILDACKYQILKYILKRIKDGTMHSPDELILRNIQHTNWPELDIILKSLKSGATKLDEIRRSPIVRVDNETEKDQIEAITKDWRSIKFLKNPSLNVQLAAVKQSSYALLHINGVLDKTIIAAIKYDPEIIAFSTRKLNENILNACKNEILKYLLTGLKTNDLSNNEILDFILFDLQPLVTWPELETIKRSVYAFKNKTKQG